MAAIGSDFVLELRRLRRVRCSECRRWLGTDESALVSRRKGVVQKRVCSEDCRLEFDARFWQRMAMRRERR